VHLVRHGQSTWNVERRVQGGSDVSILTPLGVTQAEAAAAALLALTPTAVLTSPLRRALHTARLIGECCGLPAQPRPELVEQRLGRLEGLTMTAALAAAGDLDWTDPAARPPGGESLLDVATRLTPLVAAVRAGTYGRSVVLVSHGDCLRVAACLLAGRPLVDIAPTGPANGAVLTLTPAAPG
jgi:probable phosphoglycerate mutase